MVGRRETNARNVGPILGSGRPPGGGKGNPLPYSCLGNPMDRGAWRATVHGVAKSQIRLKWLSTHMCNRFTLLYTWNQHKIVNQLYSVTILKKYTLTTTHRQLYSMFCNNWEKNLEKNRYMYMYHRITLLYTWNSHNVNQLHSEKKN